VSSVAPREPPTRGPGPRTTERSWSLQIADSRCPKSGAAASSAASTVSRCQPQGFESRTARPRGSALRTAAILSKHALRTRRRALHTRPASPGSRCGGAVIDGACPQLDHQQVKRRGASRSANLPRLSRKPKRINRSSDVGLEQTLQTFEIAFVNQSDHLTVLAQGHCARIRELV
jgi:hypothetical protein